MKQSTLDQLNAFFEKEPFLKGGTVYPSEIDSAEAALGVHFSQDYREFLERFGGAIVGPFPVYGLRRAEPMDDRIWSVLAVTNHFHSQPWPDVQSWYVVSMDHAGNPIGIDRSGKLLSFDHDSGQKIEVASDFETFLLECLKS